MVFALIGLQSATMDLHIPATTVEQALLKAGQAFGSPMVCGVTVQDKIVVIEASQVTESDFRQQMAKTLNASWERKDNRWFLTKSDTQRRQDQQRQYEYRLQSLQKMIDIRTKAPESSVAMTESQVSATQAHLKAEADQRMNSRRRRLAEFPSNASYGLPNQRFMTKVLKKVGAERLALVTPGHRVVFAINPNVVQSKLNIDLTQEMQSGANEQSTWNMAGQKSGNSGISMSFAGTTLEGKTIFFDQSFDSSYQAWPTEVQNVLLAVYCDFDGQYYITLRVVPKQDTGMPYSAAAMTQEVANEVTQPTQIPPASNEKFELSPLAATFRRWMFPKPPDVNDPKTFKFEPIPEIALSQFADVTNHDPLSFGVSEAMAFDAKRLGKNLIALVDDEEMRVQDAKFYRKWTQQPMDLDDQRRVTMDGNWILVRNSPLNEPGIPRKELKKIVSATRKLGFFTLENKAAIAGLRPRIETPAPMARFVQNFVTVHGFWDTTSDDALKCIAYLAPSEMERAMRPEGMPFGMLNTKMQNHLASCVYDNAMSRLFVSKTGGLPFYAYHEPTLMVPDGILAQTPFTITATTQFLIEDLGTPGNSSLGSSTAKDFGRMLYSAQDPERAKRYNVNWTPDRKVRLLTKVTYVFTLTPNQACYWSSEATKILMSSNKTYTLDTLPEDVKRDYQAGYEEGRKLSSKPPAISVTGVPIKQQNKPPSR